MPLPTSTSSKQAAYPCPRKTPFPHSLQWRTRWSWAQLSRLLGPLHAVLPPVDRGASQALASRGPLASRCQACCLLLAPGSSSSSTCSLSRTLLTCFWGTADEATDICGPVLPSLPRSRPGGSPPFAPLAPPARFSTHPCYMLHHSAAPDENACAHTNTRQHNLCKGRQAARAKMTRRPERKRGSSFCRLHAFRRLGFLAHLISCAKIIPLSCRDILYLCILYL